MYLLKEDTSGCERLILSQVWKHFITETDDRRWTEGKRKAEKDALVGVSFLTTIQVMLRVSTDRPADYLVFFWSNQKFIL